MEQEWIFLIFFMDQITPLGPDQQEKVSMCTKQLENFQNQKVVSLFLGIITQGLTTHWRISFAMIQPLEKFLSFM